MSDDEELLDVRQVAAWLHVEPRYVYRLVASGALTGHKLGRYVRISAGSVRAYIKATTITPPPVRVRRPGAGARRRLRRAA